MSLWVIPVNLRKGRRTFVLNEPDLEMITTPNASIPTKSNPIAVSSRTDVLFATAETSPLITIAAMKAPRAGLNPQRTANATPGITP